eukprot:5365240-Amphidinium_carterae.1
MVQFVGQRFSKASGGKQPIFSSVLSMKHRGGGSFIAHGPLNQGHVDQVNGKIVRFEIRFKFQSPPKSMGLLPSISRFFSGACLSVEG